MKEFTEHDYTSIDRYIQNDLSASDRRAFERRMLNEPELATELQWLKKFYVNYAQVGLQEKHIGLQAQVHDIHQRLSEQGALVKEPVTQRPAVPAWMAMAVCFLLVLNIGIWYWQAHKSVEREEAKQNPKKVDPKVKPTIPASNSVTMPAAPSSPLFDQLAATYGKQSPKGIGEVPDELAGAVADYKRGGHRLHQAIDALKDPAPKVIDPNEEPEYGASNDQYAIDYRHLYLGLCYLKNGQAKPALHTLSQIQNDSLTQTVQWYKALCYVRMRQSHKAKRLLTQIQHQPGHPYHREAGKLLASFTPSTQ